MKRIIFASLLASLTFSFSCGSNIDDLESERTASNIVTTEADGVVTATIQASATTDQILVGSASSKAADAAVIFPPGSLAVDTSISIGEAVNKSSEILTEIGMSGLVQAGDPVYIGSSTAGATVTVAQPLTVQLPLPLEKLEGAGLQATSSKLVILYTIFKDGAWVSGSLPVDSSLIVGTLMRLSFKGVGYFQLVYLATAGSSMEVTTAIRPLLGRNEANTTTSSEEEDEETATLAEYRGYYSGTVTEVSNLAVPGATGNGKYCLITSESFKMWLSPYDILVFKVSTPIAGNNSADFDGYVPSFDDISEKDPKTFTAEDTSYPSAVSTTDAGVYNSSGIKYSASDYQASKAFKISLAGGFKGKTTMSFEGTLSATVGDTKVCEYTLVLSKQ